MRPIALIIEDDPEIRDALGDRLDSLGHDFHAVGSQMEARERLRRCTYDYILLDLEVPVRIGRPPSIQFGKNILCEVRGDPKHAPVPVIVVTAHGHDSPELAVELMKLGADDFGNKPFHDLDEKIREALLGERGSRPRNGETPPDAVALRSLDGAELTFFEDRVELAGISICTTENGTIWRILNLLNQTRPDGQPRGFSGQRIADELEIVRGQNGVADAVSNFRDRLANEMENAGISVERDSVITRGRSGYQINPDLVIRNRTGDRPRESPRDDGLAGSEERQEWILDQLGRGAKVRRVDVERRFGKSKATAKRDFQALGEKVRFVGSGPTGYYLLKEVRTGG